MLLKESSTRRNREHLRSLFVLFGVALIPFIVTGCGGGTAAPATREAVVRFAFNWPTRAAKTAATRALTPAANSVVIAIQDAGGFADSRTLNRPAEGQNPTVIAEFFALNPGKANMTAQAFSGRDGQGERVAEGGATLDLSRNQTKETEVSFEATYSKILVTPASVTIKQNETQQFAAQGTTDSGVITQPSPKGQWTSSNTGVATIDQSGIVTAKLPGTVTVSFTDTALGRTGTATVTVQGGDAEVTLQ